jgi:hypothetical protein
VTGPSNIRRARGAERTHNSRHHHAESRPEEAQSGSRSYRGSHRAEHQHRAEDSAAHHRSSRVGRHHTEPGHW